MEQSKHSEAEIIKLGERLVKELNLEYSVNTLARWMCHYIAELIHGIDKAESNEEKKLLQQECCDVILKIWSQKENLPIKEPIDDFSEIIKILSALIKEESPSLLPTWINSKDIKDANWSTFIDMIKSTTEHLFFQILDFIKHGNLLNEDKDWISNNNALLNEEELAFIQHLDIFSKMKTGIVDLGDIEPNNDNKEKKVECIFDEMEGIINNQLKELKRLRSTYKK